MGSPRATTSAVIDVIKTNQNITISPPEPEFIYFEENLTYRINASSDSTLSPNYKIVSGNNATLSGNTINVFDVASYVYKLKKSQNKMIFFLF